MNPQCSFVARYVDRAVEITEFGSAKRQYVRSVVGVLPRCSCGWTGIECSDEVEARTSWAMDHMHWDQHMAEQYGHNGLPMTDEEKVKVRQRKGEILAKFVQS